MGQTKETSGLGRKEVKSKAEVVGQAKNDGEKVHFENLMDLCHLQNAELQGASRGGRHCQGRRRIHCSFRRARRFSFTDVGGKILGHCFQSFLVSLEK